MTQYRSLRRIAWIAYCTIVRREVVRFCRIWVQTLVPSVVTTVLYFLIFGRVLGSQLGNIHGFSYMDYIVPGLVMQAVINNSYGNVVSSFYGMRFQNNINELLIAPVSYHVIILGFISGGILRGSLIATIITGVSLLFTALPFHHALMMALVAVLSATLFALGGFINALFATSIDDLNFVPVFILVPLTYLGGVFYSVHALPELWRFLSYFNPILYMVNAYRYSLLGVSDIPISGALSVIATSVLLLYALAWYLMHRGVGIKN